MKAPALAAVLRRARTRDVRELRDALTQAAGFAEANGQPQGGLYQALVDMLDHPTVGNKTLLAAVRTARGEVDELLADLTRGGLVLRSAVVTAAIAAEIGKAVAIVDREVPR